jgi:hypothetical protein
MFIRSENLFLRPAWPEDCSRLAPLSVPRQHDPYQSRDLAHPLVITLPDVRGNRLIGTAGFRPALRGWQAQLWLAPAFRPLGLYGEAEAALNELASALPCPGGPMPGRERELIAA